MTETCGKPVAIVSGWQTRCGRPLGHEGQCVTIATGGGGGVGSPGFATGGGGGPKRAALESITPRDAFEAGYDAGFLRAGFIPTEPHDKAAKKLAWEYFQAERMKAAASTEGTE